MGTRLLGWLLLGAFVVTVLLVPAGGVVAWLIVRDQNGWGAAEKIGAIAIGVAVGAGIAAVIGAVFGPAGIQVWIDRRRRARKQTPTFATPGEHKRPGESLDERPQDRLAMRDVLRGVKDEIFKRDA